MAGTHRFEQSYQHSVQPATLFIESCNFVVHVFCGAHHLLHLELVVLISVKHMEGTY